VDAVNNPQNTNVDSPLQEWLKTQDCFDTLLKKIAPTICKKARNQNINLDAIGMDDDVNSLASCLWEFLYENHERLDDLNGVTWDSKDSKCIGIIINRFFAYCLDERRSESPFHAYYQHMRKLLNEALKEGMDITYDPARNGSSYAWTKNHGLKRLEKGELSKGVPQEESFCDWPRSDVSAKDIHNKKPMLSLSQFFWHEANKQEGTECLVPVYDLTTYVANVYGFGTFDSSITGAGVTEKSLIEDQLDKRAKMLVGFWNADERRLFLLRFDQELKLEDVAKETGYKSAAAVDYQIKKLLSVIRESWEQWQFGYSSEDDDQDTEQDFFFQRLIHFCKTLK
jgi:hypothetical protein